MPKLSRTQQELLDWLEAGNHVELGDRNRVYRATGGYWMKNTLMSLVLRGLATTISRDSWIYRATTQEEQAEREKLPQWMKEPPNVP